MSRLGLQLYLPTYKQASDRLNEIGAYCRRTNLLLIDHSHSFAFTDFGGQTGMDVLVWLTVEQEQMTLPPFESTAISLGIPKKPYRSVGGRLAA